MQHSFQILAAKSGWVIVWIIVHNCLTVFSDLDNLPVMHFHGFGLLDRSRQVEADVRLLFFDRGADQKNRKGAAGSTNPWGFR